jgi:hypothetical protein
MNSQATSVTAWMRHPLEIAARLVYLREISRTAFWEFCNSIWSKPTSLREIALEAKRIVELAKSYLQSDETLPV